MKNKSLFFFFFFGKNWDIYLQRNNVTLFGEVYNG